MSSPPQAKSPSQPPNAKRMRQGVLGLGLGTSALKQKDSSKGKETSAQSISWAREHFTSKGGGRLECKHCHSSLSESNVTRLKKHLMNLSVCKFLKTDAAAASKEKEIEVIDAPAAQARISVPKTVFEAYEQACAEEAVQID